MRRILRRSGLDPARAELEETLFHVADGYLGVRASCEEGPPAGEGPGGRARSTRGTYLNGFYDTHPIRHPEPLFGFPQTGERIVNVPDAQTIELRADGEPMVLSPGNVESCERELDMDRGTSARSFRWRSASGKRFEIRITRLCSLERPGILAVEYRVRSLDRAARLELAAAIDGDVENHHEADDPRVAAERWKPLETVRAEAEARPPSADGRARCALYLESRTRGTGFVVAAAGAFEGPAGAALSCRAGADRAACELGLDLGPGQEAILVRLTAYADSTRFADPGAEARAALASAEAAGFEALAREQAARLAAFWKAAGVSVDAGDGGSTDEALAFSLYQLYQSAPRDGRAGIPAKGLSGEGYEGHCFWDTEIYMLPFFLYTEPELARSLLRYRHSILDGARRHALELGQARGAAFPWRTIAGRECSAYYPSGSAQYHINADIAYAAWSYWEATEDLGFLAECGAELLAQTARTWLEIGHYAGGQFRIESVTGPDEYTCLVDNNFYTNAMAAHNLRAAAGAAAILAERDPPSLDRLRASIGLGPEEPGLWLRAAEGMYLPYDALRDITPQDDGFLRKAPWDLDHTPSEERPLLLHYHHLAIIRRQVCKQADAVLAHFLLPDCARESTKRASFDYYERITTHDSSLSYAAFASMAARLGEPDKALRYFSETLRLDLDDLQGNARHGIHAANLGGAWLALAFGFGGFRPRGARVALDPVLPSAWRSYSFRIAYRGSRLRIGVARGEAGKVETEVELVSGGPIEVELGGRVLKLEPRRE